MPLPNRDGCGTDSEFAAFVGTWEGGEYDFDFTLVRRVRLEINGISAAGGICGTMLYGEEMPVPPVDDPDAMYPYTGASVSPQRTWDGFVYTVVSGGAQGSSLHVGLNGSEVWAPWCEAQSPVFDSEGNAYDSCVPNLGSGEVSSTTCRLFNNEVSVEYPPAKCALCARSPVCACDAERCGVSWLHGIQITFELVTEGGTLKLTDGKMPPMRQTVLERVD